MSRSLREPTQVSRRTRAGVWFAFSVAVVLIAGLAGIGTVGLCNLELPALPLRVSFVWVCALLAIWLFWRSARRELTGGSPPIASDTPPDDA
jgi:uncharacterized membrane protein YfcA